MASKRAQPGLIFGNASELWRFGHRVTLSYSIVDLDGAAYDASDDASRDIRSKVIVCSPPRSGSYLLCEAMRRVGLGVPHEYFNTPTVQTLVTRWGLDLPRSNEKWSLIPRFRHAGPALGAYIDTLLRRRSRDGIFAMKIQFWQYRDYLDNALGDAFLDGADFVYLYRAALLDQAISLRFAKITGQWGVDGSVTTRIQPDADYFNIREIDRAIRDIRSEEKGWQRFFERRGIKPVILSYESMRSDPLSTARDLADAVSPDGPLRDAFESAPPPPKRADDDRLRQLRAEVRAAYLGRRGNDAAMIRWP